MHTAVDMDTAIVAVEIAAEFTMEPATHTTVKAVETAAITTDVVEKLVVMPVAIDMVLTMESAFAIEAVVMVGTLLAIMQTAAKVTIETSTMETVVVVDMGTAMVIMGAVVVAKSIIMTIGAAQFVRLTL